MCGCVQHRAAPTLVTVIHSVCSLQNVSRLNTYGDSEQQDVKGAISTAALRSFYPRVAISTRFIVLSTLFRILTFGKACSTAIERITCSIAMHWSQKGHVGMMQDSDTLVLHYSVYSFITTCVKNIRQELMHQSWPQQALCKKKKEAQKYHELEVISDRMKGGQVGLFTAQLSPQ